MAVETLSTLSLSTGSKTVVFSFRKAHRVNNRLLYCRRRLQQQQQQQQQVVVKATSSTEGEQNTPSAKEEEDDGQDVFAETRRESVVVSPTASEEEGVEEEDKGDNNKKKLWECSQCFGGNQSVLVSQLRDVSEVLADGFGKPADDLLNGLMQKTRWSAGNFACVIARPYGSQPYKPSKRFDGEKCAKKRSNSGKTVYA